MTPVPLAQVGPGQPGVRGHALAAACPDAVCRGADVVITALTADSRQVVPGSLFAALAGTRADGRRFINDALQRGAVAILDDGTWTPEPAQADRVCRIIHPEPRRGLSWLAAAFFAQPTRALRMVGITGTNGKTTVAAMIASILSHAGERVGVLGTTGHRWPGVERPSAMTTPDPIALQALFAEMRAAGCSAAAMEVSSHALDQRRVAAIRFDAAAFLNLTRDHLDYHGNEENYFQAKARLFQPGQCARAAIHRDDARAEMLLEQCQAAAIPTLTFAIGEGANRADLRARVDAMTWSGSRFDLLTPEGDLPIQLPVAGTVNIANALAAAALARQLEVGWASIQAGLAAFAPPPGRMQTLEQGQPFAVVVDYAHTPDALERLLRTARALTPGRLIVLFGCGGERDTSKRPLMGQIAARLADTVILTDDNPRGEDPAAIRHGIREGVESVPEGAARCLEVADREAAIARAFTLAGAGDAVLLAGKGHETGQVIAGRTLPFDDAEVARRRLGSPSSG
ncbi:MAG: UDP-N-acetylmuramoyl-L-alanyl-D-glutamate--2,6-diaminopimelate ligase [Magnetococcales bacterium]|nr:UDP-N-acetylmuramoyl-L-alanyl-D-glutamate--2,6-diaminopimelate ligase [Magnetococcales bacterium]